MMKGNIDYIILSNYIRQSKIPSRSMPHSSQKQRVSVTVDAQLLAEIDKLTENRSLAFEEALRLWRAKKIEEQLRRFYQNRSQADMKFEGEWAQFAQEQMEETLEAEGL